MAVTFTVPLYIERDEFTTDLAAGHVDGTEQEPVAPVVYLLLNNDVWDIGDGNLMVEPS